MGKRNPYRFSIKLDEEDEEHQVVSAYLNTLGRKKAKIIVKAVLSYLKTEKNSNLMNIQMAVPEEKEMESPKKDAREEKTERMLQLDLNEYSMDEAEIALMRRNYNKMGKE